MIQQNATNTFLYLEFEKNITLILILIFVSQLG